MSFGLHFIVQSGIYCAHTGEQTLVDRSRRTFHSLALILVDIIFILLALHLFGRRIHRHMNSIQAHILSAPVSTRRLLVIMLTDTRCIAYCFKMI